jgi:hypothetical protein
MNQMARHLTDSDVERVVELLDGWRGKLMWDALCGACLSVINRKPSRQTLDRSTRISSAFKATKERLKNELLEGPKLPPTLRAAAQRLERLTNENDRLKRENAQLLEQFVVWQYNAHCKGMTRDELCRPLPAVDLGDTE